MTAADHYGQDQKPGKTLISFSHVDKFYGQLHVLHDINLDIYSGEVVVLCGPSGSGKSTLLRCINALERVSTGELLVLDNRLDQKNAPLQALRRRVGMVFQNFNLYPHMTVLNNITLAPMLALGSSRAAAEKQALELLSRVGIAEKAQAHPGSLSGGQRQRVAIARALAMKPDIMLFDEPTSMVIVTHEMGFASRVADRVVFLDKGRIVEVKPPAEFFGAPEDPRAKDFLDKVMRH